MSKNPLPFHTLPTRAKNGIRYAMSGKGLYRKPREGLSYQESLKEDLYSPEEVAWHITRSELIEMPNIGKHSLEAIEEWLEGHQLTLKGTEPSQPVGHWASIFLDDNGSLKAHIEFNTNNLDQRTIYELKRMVRRLDRPPAQKPTVTISSHERPSWLGRFGP